MSDKSINNDSIENTLESLENATEALSDDAVTGVEVLKGDTIMYEDGDFEDYNADKEYETDRETKSGQDNKSDKDDKYGTTIANIYQWASKLKDDFTSEVSNMTHEVSEKAVAMMLNRLLDGIDTELEAFDKKVENSKELVANAEEERNKIADKKDKYQSMIDQLES